jgi:hypothetical protein
MEELHGLGVVEHPLFGLFPFLLRPLRLLIRLMDPGLDRRGLRRMTVGGRGSLFGLLDRALFIRPDVLFVRPIALGRSFGRSRLRG